MDKGKIERSGSVGGGVDHFTAFLNQGENWDTRDAFLEWVWQSSQGTGDPAIIDAVYCSELDEAIKRLHRIGVPTTVRITRLSCPLRLYLATRTFDEREST